MSYTPTTPTNVSGSLQLSATAAGNGTVLNVLGYATCLVTVTGTYTGLNFTIEGSTDGTTWTTLAAHQLGTTHIATALSNNGVYQVAVSGLQSVRARITAITSGNVTISGQAVTPAFTARTIDAHFADKLDHINDSITTYSGGNYITTISAATTTVVASFPIVVVDMRILAGTLGGITVYDSTTASGTTPIPTFTPDKGQVIIGSPTNFSIGCTVVTAAATIATITWRAQ